MPKCPECNLPTDYLNYFSKETESGTMQRDFNFQEDLKDIIEITFSCPFCHAELFNTENEANKFLEQPDEEE
jgi:hypothetical protein